MWMRMRVVMRREPLASRIDGTRGIRDGVGIDQSLREESHDLALALHDGIDDSYKLRQHLYTSSHNTSIHHDHTNNMQQAKSKKLRVTTHNDPNTSTNTNTSIQIHDRSRKGLLVENPHTPLTLSLETITLIRSRSLIRQ